MMRIMSRRVTVFILAAAISLLSCNGGDMAPAASYLTVPDKEIEVFSDSKSGSIVFGCDGSWTAFSEDEWIHLQENSGKGSDTDCSLVFYLDENDTGADRYGVISVSAGKFYENVMIIQSAASGHSITAFFRQVFSGNFSKVYICAHRANTYGGMYEDKNCPENSIPAIRRCIEAGLDMVELDVRKTKDGILVLCHDDKIDNVTNGSGKIADMTYAQICGYDMKIRTTGPVVPGVRIPTLSEALAECKDKIWVNLDLNKCTIPASEIVGAIEQAGMLDQVTCYTGSDAELAKEYYALNDRLSCHLSITNAAGIGKLSGMASEPLFQLNYQYYDETKDTDGLSSSIRNAGYCSFSNLLEYDSAVRKGDVSALEKFCNAKIDFLQTDYGDNYYVQKFLAERGLR